MTDATTQEVPLNSALRLFEITEANLVKLERLWKEISDLTPTGIVFGKNDEYENKCRSYSEILPHLPKIKDWKPTATPLDLDDVAQMRLDAAELQEISVTVSTENEVSSPGRELGKYRFLLNQKRQEIFRDSLVSLIDSVDEDIRGIRKFIDVSEEKPEIMSGDEWDRLQSNIGQIDTLIGSSTDRAKRWFDLHRHLKFGQSQDFDDIERMDWPSVKKSLRESMYGENEPIPTDIDNFDELVTKKPIGQIVSKLQWENISPEEFERLIFSLISNEEGYENPQWLTNISAADRGRDLSVDRVSSDRLAGVIRHRVIIQCKHWLKKSVSIDDVASLQAQMKLWEPPRVDVHIIVTSGRFTTDAVSFIEKQNQSDQALRIEMWPESHIEMLLASRPNFIAEFKLR
ncbi:MAG: restriction endonuclease [Candidatus Magasanikbacteria bacterium]